MSKTQSCALLWMDLHLQQVCRMQVSKNLQTELKVASAESQTYKHNLKLASQAPSPL